MIPFFRRIRKGMIANGKFRQYLLYALGEIVLVVIGILIALAINNAYQRQVNLNREHLYLKGLSEEFETSRVKLKELIKVNRQNYNSTKALLELMEEGKDSVNEEELSQDLYNSIALDINFNPNNSLLEEMLNSGSVKDISNARLRKLLVNWKPLMADIENQEAELSQQRNKVLDLFRGTDYSIRTVLDLSEVSQELGLSQRASRWSNQDLLQSREFENNLLTFLLTTYYTEENHYLPLQEELNTICTLLKEEIKEKS